MKLALLALVLAAVAAPELDHGTTWYMRGAGTPIAELSQTAPVARSPSDPDGDGLVGRTLGPGEYQEFLTRHEGDTIVGSPRVTIWTASAGFAQGVSGELQVDLLECLAGGCRHLAGTSMSAAHWALADTWVERTFVLAELDVTLDPGSQICVRVDAGDGVVMIAYDSKQTPSSLWLPIDMPPRTQPDGVEGLLPDPGDQGDSGDPDNPGLLENRSDLVAGTPPMVRTDFRNAPSLVGPFLVGLAMVGAVCASAAVALAMRRRR